MAIETEKLRSDFYLRLTVITLECPPLKDRKEGFTTLSRYYISYHFDREVLLLIRDDDLMDER